MDERFIKVDGDRLRALRRERALSLRELAGLTGVSHDGIQKLEAGKRGAHGRTVRTLASALGVEPAELMKGEDDG